MAGFDNDVMYADNVDFSGGSPITGKVTTDGQLLIGSTTGRNIRVNTITAGSGIVVTNGAGTITLSTNGAVVPNTITGDNALALSPTDGNWNILGSTVASGTSPLVTSGAGSTLTINAQRSQALAAADSTKVGLTNFDSAAFDVDANGFTTWTLDWKDSVRSATTAPLTTTYSNGSSGIGATLTNAGALAALTLDGVAINTIGDRVLIKDQAPNNFENGIYTLTTAGSGAVAWVLTRATDYNRIFQISFGNIVPIRNGTTQGNTSWIEASSPSIIGTDSITFGQYTFPPGSYVSYRVLLGGLTPNSPISQVASLGSSGEVLTSNGAGTPPTFQAVGNVTSSANLTDNAVVRGDGGAKGVQTSTMLISDAGEMTNPSQPAFLAYLSASSSNVIGNTSATYTIPFNAEIYDQGSDYASNTFTAPVTGKYTFYGTAIMTSVQSDNTDCYIATFTSNRTVQGSQGHAANMRNASNQLTIVMSGTVDMDAADTATLRVVLNGHATAASGLGGGTSQSTMFMGQLQL